MTRAQARLLILVLAMKRIPFVLRRNGNTYVVRFAAEHTAAVTTAVGAEVMTIYVEQVFSWTDPDGTRTIDFYIEPLLAGIADGSIPYDTAEVEIDPVWVKEWLVKRDLDPLHMATFTDTQIDTPVLGAWMEDGSVLLIDGSHRYMARYVLGKPTVRYFLVGKDAWQKHAVIVRNA